MSERRVIVSLTRAQVDALLRAAAWVRGIGSLDQGAIRDAAFELCSALAIYDLTQSTVSRLAAVPNLDAGSLIEHDASHSDPYHYPERGE